MMDHEASPLSDSAPRFKYDQAGQRLERIDMSMPTATQTALETAALHAGRTFDEQLTYMVQVCSGTQRPDREDPRTLEEWLRLYYTIEFLGEERERWRFGYPRGAVASTEWDADDPGGLVLRVSLPAEITLQMVEAQPSIHDSHTVTQIKALRAHMKREGFIPQFEDEPERLELPVTLHPGFEEAVSEDARAAGRTVVEQIEYEIEVNHGWRFPDLGDTAFEERIRTLYTLREWVNLYLRFHVRLSGGFHRDRAKVVLNHFGPLLSVSPSEVSRASVMQWAQSIGRQHPQAARNALIRLRNIYNKATEWGLYEGDNPVARCQPFQTRPRERFLFPAEWERVRLALEAEPLKIRVYFYFLLLSGARMSEVRLMEWRHVDFTGGLWYKPTTKNGRSQILPLSSAMAALLDSLPRDSRYCFHGDPTNNNVNLDGPWSRRPIGYHWARIRTAAGIEDVRIHDLRRTCGSWLTMHGENLAIVKDVLHHRNIQTTMIYARLDQGAVRAALDRHAQRMLLPEPVDELLPKSDMSQSISQGEAGPPETPLSPQQQKVLAGVADGKTNKEIALAFGLSDKTVKNYLRKVFQKLNVTRRSQAVAKFMKGA